MQILFLNLLALLHRKNGIVLHKDNIVSHAGHDFGSEPELWGNETDKILLMHLSRIVLVFLAYFDEFGYVAFILHSELVDFPEAAFRQQIRELMLFRVQL